jgi:hypothetical protein
VCDAEGSAHRGKYVGERTSPVGRLDEPVVHDRVRADSDSAKASNDGTASGPSAVAETRIEKSSEARTPE